MPTEVQAESFEQVEAEWEAVLPLCSTNNIFVTPWWQRTWLRHFGDESELLVLTVRRNGSLLGIAPLTSSAGVISFLGGTDLFDYHDFLVPKGGEAEFYGALFDHLSALDWHEADLKSIPTDSPTLELLPELARRKGYAVEVEQEDTAPLTPLPSSWEEYQAGLSKKHRHELRRKFRKMEKAGGARHYSCEASELHECLPDFFRLHRASKPEKRAFMTPERERFFTDAAAELAARGQLRLDFLEVDGLRVAACMSFDYLDSELLYNSGYDREYSSLSVGLLSKALAIKRAIASGKSTFEFLRGPERYKYELGAQDRAIYQMAIRR